MNDVLDMTGSNVFATTGRHQLLVKGTTGDSIDLADATGTTGWTISGTIDRDGATYNAWGQFCMAGRLSRALS